MSALNTLSPGLQALVTLQQTANPTAPGPQGQPPMPSVAAQAAQKAQMTMQQGIAGAPPQPQGIASALNQAQIAAPSVAQNAQEAQAMQMAQKVAELMQSQQAQGVAGLPANNMRGFKEGGIIGFNGEQRADVPLPSDMRPWSRFPANSLMEGLSNPVQRTRDGKYLYNGKIYPDKESAERVAIATYQGKEPFVPNELGVPRDTGSRPGAFEANFTPTGIAAAIPASAAGAPARSAAPAPAPAAGAPARSAAPAPAPGNQDTPSSDIFSRLIEFTKPPPETEDERKYKAEVEKAHTLRQTQPPVQQTALAALQRAIQEREEQQQNINSQAGLRRLDAYLAGAQRGRGRGGEEVANFRNTEESRKAEYIQRKLLDATALSVMEDAQRAQAAGNQGAYVEALGKLASINNEKEKSRVQNLGNVLQAGAQMNVGAANNATQLQVARIQAAVGHGHNAILERAQGTKEQQLAAKIEADVNKDPLLETLAKQGIDPKNAPAYIAYKNELIARAYQRQDPELYKKLVAAGAMTAPGASTEVPQGAVRLREGNK